MDENTPRTFGTPPPTYLYFDGTRLVCFTDSERTPRPSTVDKFRAFVEKFLGFRIDWWPFPPVLYECLPGFTRLSWEWSTLKLHADIPTDIANKYRLEACEPVRFPSDDPRQAYTLSRGPDQSNITTNQDHVLYPTDDSHGIRNSVTPAHLYWCVKKSSDETRLCTEDGQTLGNDYNLCTRLRERYNLARGFLRKYFSWGKCLGVEFTMLYRVFENSDEVVCIRTGLPSLESYEYSPVHPEVVHMAITTTQLAAGMEHNSVVEGNTTLSLLPRKIDGALGTKVGSEAWGIRGVEGWSFVKMLLSMVMINLICFVSVVLLQCLVDSVDVQAAIVPTITLSSIWYLNIGWVQFIVL